MARIQVLRLPDETAGPMSRTPFVLVLDELGAVEVHPWIKDLKKNVGAEAVICFSGTMDVVDEPRRRVNKPAESRG